MGNTWKLPPLPASDEFNDFLDLYKAYLADATADPLRLKLKVQGKWDSLTKTQKKEWTERLVAAGVMEEKVVNVIKMYHGSLARVT